MGILLLTGAGLALAGDWAVYHAEDYGFSMLMPVGTVFAEREYFDGWAELYAEYEGVKFYGLTKRGELASPEEIERVGIKFTRIAEDYWTVVREGENVNGWIWYTTVEVVLGNRLLVGDYGVGPSGSYLLLLETTVSDYKAYKSDYIDWYNSIELY